MDDHAKSVALLAAQIAADQPGLPHALRHASDQVCRYAGLLEAALQHFRPLEGYLAAGVRLVERRTGHQIDDALFNRLAERFQIPDVRIALQRVEDAHPDALDSECEQTS
jgi:hypothetical protein